MGDLILHKRYNKKLIITVTFIMMMVAVVTACGIAGVSISAAEKSTTDTGTENISQTASESTSESSTEYIPNKTGTVKLGAKKVNVRSSASTSSSSNIIKQVNGGLKVEILDTVYVSDTYCWYKVSFYMDGSNITGYISGTYVTIDSDVDYSENDDFEAYLTSQNFPESYKESLRELHKKYPKWVFVADHVSTSWNDMVNQQNVQGRALISASSISSWKSTETTINSDGTYKSIYYNWDTGTWYPWDGGSWVQASKELIEYTLDPRNFLNETNVFMFEKLSLNSNIHTAEGVSNIISDTFMNNSSHELIYEGKKYSYADALLYAGQVSKVSPYHLAVRIIQEQGRYGTGRSISGTVSGYEGYYNYFNNWASAGATGDPVVNGLKVVSDKSITSYLRPWDSRMKSIMGGSIYLGEKYIARGQDTLYYQKYDLIGYYGYLHQYMTHVLAPRSESVNAAKAYSDSMKANTPLVFYIPVYKDMPAAVCTVPTKDGSPNNTLSGLSVSNQTITPDFGKFVTNYDMIVEYEVSSININAVAADSKAKITGAGTVGLSVGNNRIDVVVKAENGDERTYTINVVRKEQSQSPTNPPTEQPTNPPTEEPTDPPTVPGNQYDLGAYKVDDANHLIYGFTVGDTVDTVLEKIPVSSDVTKKILNSGGEAKTGVVATGDRFVLYKADGSELKAYDVVVYGDANGDGAISLIDIVRVQRIMLGKVEANGAYKAAADATRDGKISLVDIVRIQRHMLGKTVINQL